MRATAELAASVILAYACARLILGAYHGPRDGIPAGIFRPDDAALLIGAMVTGAMLARSAWRLWQQSRARRR